MNTRITWALVAAAVVLFAFIHYVERPIRLEQMRQTDRKVLGHLHPAGITSVLIRPAGEMDIRAVLTNGLWRLTRPISYPADAEKVGALLRELAGLEWQSRITADELKDRPDAQETFGFSKPQFSIDLEGAGENRHLLVGDTGPMGDQVYLQIIGDDIIFIASSDLLKFLPHDKNQWRDRTVIDLSGKAFQTLNVQSAGKGFDLERDPATRLWFMKTPLQARADSEKINRLLADLQALRAGAFVSDDPQADLEPFGLQAAPQAPELELSFLRETNLVASLRVGKTSTNDPSLAFARRPVPGNILLVPHGPLDPWMGAYTNFLDRHLISQSPSLVDSIETRARGEDPFTIRQLTNGQWRIQGPETFDADPILMRDWLAGFTNIEAGIEQTVVADFTPYGLNPPLLQYALKSSLATGQSNQILAQIQFGATQGDKVFERRTDEPSVNFISREQFDRLPRASWQLRDRRIWNFESNNVVAITIHQLGYTRKMIRDPFNEWTFGPGYIGMINPFHLEEALYRLGRLKAVYWSGRGEDPDDRFGFAETAFDFSLEIKTGGQTNVCSIQFGKPSPHLHPYAAVVKNGRRLIFEFPVDLYENFVKPDFTIPPAFRTQH